MRRSPPTETQAFASERVYRYQPRPPGPAVLTLGSGSKVGTIKALAVTAAAVTVGGCTLLPNSATDAADQTSHITADFDNIAGIYEGNPITVLGLDVGKVDKIVPKGTLVEVHMSIDKDVKIPKDAIAAI
ncbi:MlaD family protein, partial [Nocardia asiatica]|uniref:MlaD family protein n=1 Tax=Nocardia asiatica TaxID=209252 RepID=UPI0024556D7C